MLSVYLKFKHEPLCTEAPFCCTSYRHSPALASEPFFWEALAAGAEKKRLPRLLLGTSLEGSTEMICTPFAILRSPTLQALLSRLLEMSPSIQPISAGGALPAAIKQSRNLGLRIGAQTTKTRASRWRTPAAAVSGLCAQCKKKDCRMQIWQTSSRRLPEASALDAGFFMRSRLVHVFTLNLVQRLSLFMSTTASTSIQQKPCALNYQVQVYKLAALLLSDGTSLPVESYRAFDISMKIPNLRGTCQSCRQSADLSAKAFCCFSRQSMWNTSELRLAASRVKAFGQVTRF